MSERDWGVVKWFGGYNNKTGKENDYGFLIANDGTDVYFHRKSVSSDFMIMAGMLLTFDKLKDKDKLSAKNLKELSCLKNEVSYFLNILHGLSESNLSLETRLVFKKSILQSLFYSMINNDFDEEWVDWGNDAEIFFVRGVFDNIGDSHNLRCFFKKFFLKKSLNELLDDFGFSYSEMFSFYIDENINGFLSYAYSLRDEERDSLMQLCIGNVSEDVQLVIFATGLVYAYDYPDHYRESLFFLKESLRQKNTDQIFLSIVKESYNVSAPLEINAIIDELVLKNNLYLKKSGSLARLQQSSRLKGRLDLVVIFNILHWLSVGNDEQAALRIAASKVWEAFASNEIKEDDLYSLNNAFPSCSAMRRYGLSCEAVFWEEKKIYLCRKKKCDEPKVFPDLTSGKSYFDYNLYDWLHYYGFYKLSCGEPIKRDFPIKLAGYFNRLREIFNSLKCRACHSLMTPDLKYARTKYKSIENGQIVEKELMAAYRVTVFECSKVDCHMHGQKHYLNHCLNYKCQALIDSRDCLNKCDNGYYSCNKCGQCCSKHHPK